MAQFKLSRATKLINSRIGTLAASFQFYKCSAFHHNTLCTIITSLEVHTMPALRKERLLQMYPWLSMLSLTSLQTHGNPWPDKPASKVLVWTEGLTLCHWWPSLGLSPALSSRNMWATNASHICKRNRWSYLRIHFRDFPRSLVG